MIGTLVGRTAEMAALGDVAGVAAATGRPAVGLVIGAAGLGKSRLLREIGDTVEADLRISLVGYEPEQSVPLAAARPLLSAVQRDRDELEGGPEPSWLEPIRLFEATHQAIRGAGRVLLTLDDLQWMDGTSVALCHYLLRAAEHESGTVDHDGGRASDPDRRRHRGLLRTPDHRPDSLRPA
ncbi:MAG: ATP-binding protein [Candidatus Limnocylindrales bacterium]